MRQKRSPPLLSLLCSIDLRFHFQKNKTLNSSIYLGFYGVCVKDERAMGFVTLLLSSKYIHSLDSSLLSSLVVKKTHTRDVVCCCERRRRLRRRRVYSSIMQNAASKVNAQAASGAIQGILGLGAVSYGLYHSLFNVEGGHRAIVYNRAVGLKDTSYAEGTHLMIPWIERPIVYDVRSRAHQVSSTSGSKDLQMVNLSIRVLTRPDANKLPQIYRELGTDFNERVLPSLIHDTLKSVVAQHNASELITKRENVSLQIRNMLIQRAKTFHMILDDVSITALTFGREYTAAIEAKQVAQQDAERAKFIVERAKQDKKSAVIRADGEAKSAKLIGEAISTNPAFLTLRRIEAAREIAETMARSNNRVMLNADSLLLNLAEEKVTQGKH